jgi:hypothetical protein
MRGVRQSFRHDVVAEHDRVRCVRPPLIRVRAFKSLARSRQPFVRRPGDRAVGNLHPRRAIGIDAIALPTGFLRLARLARPHGDVPDDHILAADRDPAANERHQRRRRLPRDGNVVAFDLERFHGEIDHAADFEHNDARPLGLHRLGDRTRPLWRQRRHADDAPAIPAGDRARLRHSPCRRSNHRCRSQQEKTPVHVPRAFAPLSSTLASFGRIVARSHCAGSNARFVIACFG